MSTFTGEATPTFDYPYLNGWNNRDGPEQWITESLIDPVGDVLGGSLTPGSPTASPSSFDGLSVPGPGDDWFERIILMPGTLNFGLILSPSTFNVVIYNSFRRASKVFEEIQSFVSEGVDLPDAPILPETIQPQDEVSLTVRVLTSGPPKITGYFQFSVGAVDLLLLVTGQRGIFLLLPPEVPMTEKLQFLTDILERADGTEQRISLRQGPRQTFELILSVDGEDKDRLNAILLGAQDKLVGVPVWYESAKLTAVISMGDNTIQVDSTAYMDIRVGGLVVVFDGQETFEVLEVESFDATSITLSSDFTADFEKTALVMPVRSGNVSQEVRGVREKVNLQTSKVTFSVLDNVLDLASAAGFSSFEDLPLLSDPNAVDSQLADTLSRKLHVFDNQTGIRTVDSPWDLSRRSQMKRFVTHSKQRLWEVRQLLHYLRGRNKSFFIPSFYDDLEVTQNVSAGSATITVRNIGYTKFIQGRQPADVLRLLLKDGTSVVRRVIGYEELGEDEEVLTVFGNWGVTTTPADIRRLEFVEKARLDSDEVVLTHFDALGTCFIDVPVKATLS